MSSFELDVTKPVGDFSITTPDGKITFDVMDITKEPMMLFQNAAQSDNGEVSASAVKIIDALASVMRPQNGGVPAGELFTRLYDDGLLGVHGLRQISEFVMNLAVGDPPA